MTENTMRNVLREFGLTDTEASVYLFLSKRGALKGTQIAKQLGKDKAQVYHVLKSLQVKGLVESTLESPVRFVPVAFETVVESAIKAKQDEAAHIESTKQELLDYWKNLNKGKSELPLEKFRVIEGRHKIYLKISQMVSQAKRQVFIISPLAGLIRAEQYGVYDSVSKMHLKSKVQFRFLTELHDQNLQGLKSVLKKMYRLGFDFKVRSPDLGQGLFPQMIIRDDEETVFFISPNGQINLDSIQDEVCLWTNCKSLVQAFTVAFDGLWQNSTDIQNALSQTETGSSARKTCIIQSAKAARSLYDELLQSAQKEIIMVTSSEGLMELPDYALKALTKRHVLTKIMVPITNENLKYAQTILKYAQIRHIAEGYLATTIIDSKHLFQFKNPAVYSESKSAIGGAVCFEDSFYSNDVQYIEKTKALLDDFWMNAQPPSDVTLQAWNNKNANAAGSKDWHIKTFQKVKAVTILKTDFDLPITEKEVLDKIIHAEKYQTQNQTGGVVRTFGANAQAIIHPPSQLNLPDILFYIFHMEKHSTFGAQDAMLIHFWLDTPVGYSYVPVAFITDNPDSLDFWRAFLAGVPAAGNVQLTKKEAFEVQVHGNVFFAGWTVPISIPPYNLPPSCIIVEGNGEIRPGFHFVAAPSGFKMTSEHNASDAFVTFLHPASKYSGPGTDGVFGRDVIMELYPPKDAKSAVSN